MATTEQDTPTTTDFGEKRKRQLAIEAALAEAHNDVMDGMEPEWRAVVVPRWNNRTVWIRGMSMGEREQWRKVAFKTTLDETGQSVSKDTGEFNSYLLHLTAYIEVEGEKVRLFPDYKKHRGLILGQFDALADITAVALDMSGLSKKAQEKVAADFLAPETTPNDGGDIDSLEIWESPSPD